MKKKVNPSPPIWFWWNEECHGCKNKNCSNCKAAKAYKVEARKKRDKKEKVALKKNL
jgi:hypothetical protein